MFQLKPTLGTKISQVKKDYIIPSYSIFLGCIIPYLMVIKLRNFFILIVTCHVICWTMSPFFWRKRNHVCFECINKLWIYFKINP